MKQTKKIISLLLSLLMVVSTLPMTAITANAASSSTTPNVNYLVDEIDSVFRVSGKGVTWTTAPDGVQAAYFDGSSGLFYNAESLLNNMTSDNQTISFATYTLNGNNDSAKFFDICTNDPSASDEDTIDNRSVSVSNSKTRISCYSTSSWYSVVSNTYDGNTGAWDYWTITMKNNHCYVYRNGISLGELSRDNESISGGGTAVITRDQFSGSSNSANYIALGMSSIDSLYFKGYIRDFRIYYNDYTSSTNDINSIYLQQRELAESTKPVDPNAPEVKEEVMYTFSGANTTYNKNGTAQQYYFKDNTNNTYIAGCNWGTTASHNSDGYIALDNGTITSVKSSSMVTSGDAISGVTGENWSVSMKYQYNYTSDNAYTTLFGIGSHNIVSTQSGGQTNDSSYMTNGRFGADLIQVYKDGRIYINGTSTSESVTGTLLSDSVKTITFEYDNGTIKVLIDGVEAYSKKIDASLTEKFEAGPGNFFVGTSAANLAGGTWHYLGRTNTGYSIHSFKLYEIKATKITIDPGDSIIEIPEATLTAVDNAMKAFEDMADNGFLYNNTKPAYEAYVALQKARDAAKYGNDKAAINSLDEKATTLDAEVRKMTGFNYPTATATAYYGTNAATGLYSNVLYSDQTVGKGGQTANFNGWSAYVQMLNNTNYVLMYDGVNEASAPIYLRWKHANTTNYLFYCFPVNSVNSTSANDYFKLNQYWIGNRWSGDATQDGTYFGEHANGQKLNYTERDDDKYGQYSLGNYTFYYKNKLIYKGTGNTTSYYEDISSIPFQIKAYAGTDWSSAQNNSSKKKIFYPTLPSGNHIYVINYKALRDKLEAEKDSAVLKSIKNYSEGGAKSYINNLNSAMLVKPSSYSYSSGVRLAVLVCATDISTAIANLNSSASTSTANNTGYASIRTALNTAMSITEQDTYCPGRWTAFSTARANAMNAMKTVNTKGYTLSSDEAQELADALNTAEAILLEGHNWSLTERTPATCNAKGSEKYICTTADCGATKTEEIAIDSNAHNYGAWQSDKSSTYCYRQCSVCEGWDTRLHDSNTELPAVAATCTTTGLTEGYKCSVCGRVMVAQEIIPINDNHDYTLTVSKSNDREVYTWTNVCSRDASHNQKVKELDFSAYNAAVAEANAKLAETAKYTADSLTALRNTVNDNKVVDADKLATSTLTDIQLDAKAAAITTAIEGLALKSFTVDVVYIKDGVEIGREERQSVQYGCEAKLTAKSKYSVIKWVASYEASGDVKVAETAQSITAIVKSNVTYNVTVNDVTENETSGNNAVKLYNRTNKLADIAYIPTGNYNVSISGNTITIGPYKLVAPEIVFYTVSGFQINGQAIVKGTTLSINSETNIKAVYTPAKEDLTITCDGTCTANVDTAYWNQKVVVTADNSIANPKWIVNGEVVAYGRTYTFMATTNVSVKCVDDDEVAQPVATVLNLGYGSMREKTISAVCSYYVPEGYTFKEAGVLLKTSAVNNNTAVDNVDNYTGANDTIVNAKKFMATEFVNPTRQYVINVSSSKEYNELYMGAVAYVVVETDDGQQTFYSSLVTYDYVKPSQNAN